MPTKKTSKLEFLDKYKILTEDAVDLDTRTIYLFEELDSNLGTALRLKYAAIKAYWQDELKQEFKDISVNISSYGGAIYSIHAALDFYDELKEQQILVNTIAQGVCMSAATIVLAGATGIRTASKRCRFMLHDIQVENTGGNSATQLIQFAKTLDEEQQEFFKFYVQYSRPKGTPELNEAELKRGVKKWIKRFGNNSLDHYVTADVVKELGLIDTIA